MAARRFVACRAVAHAADRQVDPARLYTPESYRRLRRVKSVYDPGELFVANHPVPPA